jgi:hypothetical protein
MTSRPANKAKVAKGADRRGKRDQTSAPAVGKVPPATPFDEARDLADIEIFIGRWVRLAIQAHVVMRGAYSCSSEHPTLFARHPAITFQFDAMDSLERIGLVHLGEVLKSSALSVPTDLRGRLALNLHRHVISHPYTTEDEWKHENVKKFVKAKRHLHDNRAVLVWQLYRSVTYALKKHGRAPKHPPIEATLEMAQSLELIWRQSMNEEGIRRIGTIEQVMAELREYHVEYMRLVDEKAAVEDGAG